MKLANKTALITGANRGIGRACAIELAREGADIAVCYRSHPDEADDVLKDIRRLGMRGLTLKLDIGDFDSIRAGVAGAIRALGRLDILVLNAAYVPPRLPLWELPVEEFDRTMHANLTGNFLATQLFTQHLLARKATGKIVFISSIMGLLSYPTSTAYNCAKAGGDHLVRTMAAELTPYHINVNSIQPGWIDTPGERKFTTDDEMAKAAANLPWGRLGTAEDIAYACVFLCSPEADYITGATLCVDGGWMARTVAPLGHTPKAD